MVSTYADGSFIGTDDINPVANSTSNLTLEVLKLEVVPDGTVRWMISGSMTGHLLSLM